MRFSFQKIRTWPLLGLASLLVGLASLGAQDLPAVQYRPEVEEAFQLGVALHNNGQYDRADKVFRELTGGPKPPGTHSWHQRASAALYMNASTAFQLGQYLQAIEYLQHLLDNFPASKYVEFAHELRGAIYFKQERFAEAAREFLWVVDHGTRQQLVHRNTLFARSVLTDYLSTMQLEQLQSSPAGEAAQALITLQTARNQIAAGDRDAAVNAIEAFNRSHPRNKFLDEFNSLLTAPTTKSAVAHVGVVVPLSGEFAQEGTSLYQGMKYAFEGFRRDKKDMPPVALVVKDSGSNVLQALRSTQTLLEDPSVIALIGELETDISGSVAGLAQATRVPIVVPTPTVNDLTSLGENVFQANANLEAKGSSLARFAIEQLGLRTFATIAPQDEYGRQMTDGFSVEVDRLGGQILAQKWYYESPDDLSRHFKSIREIAFRRMLQDSLVAGGKSLAEINLNAEWRAYDELFKEQRQKKSKEGMVESMDVPVTNIDAIFLPVYADEVGTIARQVSYFNIRAQILGGEHWYIPDLDKSRELQRYVSSAIFASDYFLNMDDTQFNRLRSDFRSRTGRLPGTWEIFGIDAARLILSAFASGARTRTQMRKALASTQDYAVLRGKIDFQPGERMNHHINLVQIRQNKFEKLQ